MPQPQKGVAGSILGDGIPCSTQDYKGRQTKTSYALSTPHLFSHRPLCFPVKDYVLTVTSFFCCSDQARLSFVTVQRHCFQTLTLTLSAQGSVTLYTLQLLTSSYRCMQSGSWGGSCCFTSSNTDLNECPAGKNHGRHSKQNSTCPARG